MSVINLKDNFVVHLVEINYYLEFSVFVENDKLYKLVGLSM